VISWRGVCIIGVQGTENARDLDVTAAADSCAQPGHARGDSVWTFNGIEGSGAKVAWSNNGIGHAHQTFWLRAVRNRPRSQPLNASKQGKDASGQEWLEFA